MPGYLRRWWPGTVLFAGLRWIRWRTPLVGRGRMWFPNWRWYISTWLTFRKWMNAKLKPPQWRWTDTITCHPPHDPLSGHLKTFQNSQSKLSTQLTTCLGWSRLISLFLQSVATWPLLNQTIESDEGQHYGGPCFSVPPIERRRLFSLNLLLEASFAPQHVPKDSESRQPCTGLVKRKYEYI